MLVAYIDECGMASIAGPGAVCAVVADPNMKKIDGVRDSKQLSKIRREGLYRVLKSRMTYSYQTVTIERIEEINLHWAKYESMGKAILDLVKQGHNIDKVVIDGKFTIPNFDIPQEAIIKADDKIWQVGAASIIGKVTRDNYMAKLAKKYEQYSCYDWENNAGYYSPKHRMGIILHGPCDLHRKTFTYFQYCLDRHKEYERIVAKGDSPNEFLNRVVTGEDKKSDYTLWKEAKKNIWQPVLPNLEEK